MSKQLLLLGFLFLSVGCEKITTDLANTEAPTDAPQYTVEFNPNRSPVEAANPDTSR